MHWHARVRVRAQARAQACHQSLDLGALLGTGTWRVDEGVDIKGPVLYHHARVGTD